jgi:predicted ArsR family transcriptional regulator
MDDLLLSKVRLTVITELLSAHWMSFTELQKSVEASGGNLAAHLLKLVNEGYVEEEKRFIGRRPQTRYRLSRKGRAAFLDHIAWLNAIVTQLPSEHGASPLVKARPTLEKR